VLRITTVHCSLGIGTTQIRTHEEKLSFGRIAIVAMPPSHTEDTSGFVPNAKSYEKSTLRWESLVEPN
jgi:hypothetical protein